MDMYDDNYEKFNLDSMYQLYLRKMKLDESRMQPSQRIERKRAWLSGFAMALVALLNDGPDDEAEFEKAVFSMQDQIVTLLEKSIEEADALNIKNSD